MKALIIDDEEESRNLLEKSIASYCRDIAVVGMASSGEEAYKLILQQNPDLIFLDIEMPNGSGFDLLKKFRDISFEVIFVTGFDHYALNAIKFNCLDFLLKPLNIDELIEAVEKARVQVENKDLKKRINNLLANLKQPAANNKIALPTIEGIEFLPVNSIIRLEANGPCTWIYADGQKKILSSKILKEFEQLLGGFSFFRTHRAHIVNLEFVHKFIKTEGGYLIMSDNTNVPVSRRNREALLEKLLR